MFEIVVTEIKTNGSDAAQRVERFKQIVDDIDLPGVIASVNRKRRAPRTPKVKP